MLELKKLLDEIEVNYLLGRITTEEYIILINRFYKEIIKEA